MEFHYGSRLTSETGSSVVSVDCDILSKFGMLIDFDVLQRVPSLNQSWKLICYSVAAILKNRYDVIARRGWFALNEILYADAK